VYGWRLAFGALWAGVDGGRGRIVSLGVPAEEIQSGPGVLEIVVVPMIVHVGSADCFNDEIIWYYHLWWCQAVGWCMAEESILVDDFVVV